MSNGKLSLTIESTDPNANTTYTINWCNGQTTNYPSGDATMNGLSAGKCLVKVTSSDGCIVTKEFTIPQSTNLPLTLDTEKYNACPEGALGKIVVKTNGGTPPFSFVWNDGFIGKTLRTGLASGKYTITAKDHCGTIINKTFDITRFELNLVATESCAGQGIITANPTNGNPPYTYIWSTGATTSSISNLQPGTYEVIVTDTYGCKAHRIATLQGKVLV